MAKISKEEYEKLKRAKADGYEWVAKDMSGGVFAYKIKPEKYSYSWIDDNNYRIISSRGSELEVLRWGDEEPYSIQEPIEEYEKESEETEVKKDIEFSEELQKSIMRAFDVEETFKTIEALTGMTLEQIAEEAINGGIVPKQKLPVIPNHIAKWISVHHERFDLYPALKRLENNALSWEDVYDWYRKNTRKFVNAYLTGKYEVEEEHPQVKEDEDVKEMEEEPEEYHDPVHRPEHYMQGHIETIDKIKLLLTPEEYLGYLKGNVIKYDRAPFKGNMEQDYDKQKVYYEWALEQMGEREWS